MQENWVERRGWRVKGPQMICCFLSVVEGNGIVRDLTEMDIFIFLLFLEGRLMEKKEINKNG